MKNLQDVSLEVQQTFHEALQTVGWICPRCQKSLAPSVKECSCKAKFEELRK